MTRGKNKVRIRCIDGVEEEVQIFPVKLLTAKKIGFFSYNMLRNPTHTHQNIVVEHPKIKRGERKNRKDGI